MLGMLRALFFALLVAATLVEEPKAADHAAGCGCGCQPRIRSCQFLPFGRCGSPPCGSCRRCCNDRPDEPCATITVLALVTTNVLETLTVTSTSFATELAILTTILTSPGPASTETAVQSTVTTSSTTTTTTSTFTTTSTSTSSTTTSTTTSSLATIFTYTRRRSCDCRRHRRRRHVRCGRVPVVGEEVIPIPDDDCDDDDASVGSDSEYSNEYKRPLAN